MSLHSDPTFDPRAVLEREQHELITQLSELGFGGGVTGNYDSNFADSSQVTAEKGESEALAESLSSALGDVQAALARLDLGTYGKCERCGEQISEVRLEAVPTARLCMSCASRR